MTANTNKLHQINMQYSPVEDRILVRTSTTNNEEYLIWLTRRYTRILLDLIQKEIDERGGTTNVASKQETKQLFKQGAFEKPYAEEQPKTKPLGDKGILAYAIKSGKDSNGNFVLELKSNDNKGITYNLNDTMLYMVYSLLSQSIAKAEWNLGYMEQPTSQSQIH